MYSIYHPVLLCIDFSLACIYFFDLYNCVFTYGWQSGRTNKSVALGDAYLCMVMHVVWCSLEGQVVVDATHGSIFQPSHLLHLVTVTPRSVEVGSIYNNAVHLCWVCPVSAFWTYIVVRLVLFLATMNGHRIISYSRMINIRIFA